MIWIEDPSRPVMVLIDLYSYQHSRRQLSPRRCSARCLAPTAAAPEVGEASLELRDAGVGAGGGAAAPPPPPAARGGPRGWTASAADHADWRHFAGGALGGALAATVTCPLEVLKTRLQARGGAELVVRRLLVAARRRGRRLTAFCAVCGGCMCAPARRGGTQGGRDRMVRMMRAIVVREGPRALWKGLAATVGGVAPARAIYFGMLGWAKGAAGTRPRACVRAACLLCHSFTSHGRAFFLLVCVPVCLFLELCCCVVP